MNIPERINRRMNGRRWLLLVLLIALVGLGVAFYGPLKDFTWRVTEFLLDVEGARAYILEHQPYSIFYFIGLQVLQVIISPIPGEVSCFLGGLVFGWALGFLYSCIGLTIGSLVNVSVGRAFERVFLEKIIPVRVLDRFEARAKKWGLLSVFILFLFPGAPKDTLCFLFGLTRIPIIPFLLVSSVARMPGTLVLNLQGAKVIEGDWTFFIILTVTGIAVAVPALIFKERIFRRFGITDGYTGEAGCEDDQRTG